MNMFVLIWLPNLNIDYGHHKSESEIFIRSFQTQETSAKTISYMLNSIYALYNESCG